MDFCSRCGGSGRTRTGLLTQPAGQSNRRLQVGGAHLTLAVAAAASLAGVCRDPGAFLLNRLADAIARISLLIACTLTAAVFLLINVEVVCRYVFGTSTLIADEYAAYGFAGLVYQAWSTRYTRLVDSDRHSGSSNASLRGRR